MDNSLHELEDELKTLQPRCAAPRWLDEVNRELAAELPAPPRPRYASATSLNSWKWLGWRTVGVAAALTLVAAAVLVSFRQSQPAVTAPGLTAVPTPVRPTVAATYEPVAAANVLYDLKDEGEVKIAGATSARQVRARYVDTYTWKNPRNNASIKWTVPRDEVRVVPASYNPN